MACDVILGGACGGARAALAADTAARLALRNCSSVNLFEEKKKEV